LRPLLQHRCIDDLARRTSGPFCQPLAQAPNLAGSLDHAEAGAHRTNATDRHIGRSGHREPDRRKAQHQPVHVLARRQVLALAHDVPDIAEHEEIAGDRAREACDIVGISGHETGGKAPGKIRRRIRFRDRIADALRQFLADDDASVAREFDEACGEVGIIGRQRRLDILGDQPGAVPQGRIELQVGELARLVLRRQNGAGIAGMRPQRRAHGSAERHACESHYQGRAEPQPPHPKKSNVFTSLNMAMPLLRHNCPDERRASLRRQDCVEFA